MKESDILHETKNLALVRADGRLELLLTGATHALVIGHPRSVDAGRRTMERLERYPQNLRAMYSLPPAAW